MLAILTEVSAQYIFKSSYHEEDTSNVWVGVVLYIFSGYFAYRMLEYGELGVINLIWHLCYFLLLFAVGYWFLDEKITGIKFLASLLGIISLFLFLTD
jgi:multidrug transporter EmrE-like cation transporter